MRALVIALLAVGVAAPLQAQSALVGYVRDSSSAKGLPGAEVTVGNDKKARTDKDGRYIIRDVPNGAQHVQVRLVGFAPVDTTFEFANKPKEGIFFLGKPAVMLDSVVSTGRQKGLPGAGFEGFAERRKAGFGKFIDSTELRANEHRQLADLLNNIPSVFVTVPATCTPTMTLGCSKRVAVSRKGGQDTYCAYQVVLDGTVLERGAVVENLPAPPFSPPNVVQAYNDAKEKSWSRTFDLNSISISNLAGVEIYRSAADAPMIFGGDTSGCGVLVLWTRR